VPSAMLLKPEIFELYRTLNLKILKRSRSNLRSNLRRSHRCLRRSRRCLSRNLKRNPRCIRRNHGCLRRSRRCLRINLRRCRRGLRALRLLKSEV